MTNKILELVKFTLRHMDAVSSGEQLGAILLSGDPGIGKTSYIELLGQLLGLKAIVIEVPHIVEEHLINIPFIVFNTKDGTKTQQIEKTPPIGADGAAVRANPKYKMILAQSKLYSHLMSAQALSDQQYLQYMAAAPAHIQNIFTQLGGTVDKIPPVIAKARAKHKVILFLDEYYRKTTLRIRNILRGLLSRKIGMHKIPQSVYIVYASNMVDNGGLDTVTTNQHGSVYEFAPPTKEEWFDWLISTYEADARVELNPKVIDKFKNVLIDDDVSYSDFASGVRTSPRRWEQIILYINTSLPVSSQREAELLLHNVKNNFVHYKDQTSSTALMNKVLKATTELIEETSGISVNSTSTVEDHDWREAFSHMIEQYKKASGRRKHVPIISGPPGIGKTSHMAKVAADNDLLLVEIIVSDLNSDDMTGIIYPGDRTENEIKVNFSMPKLYQQIMIQINEERANYEATLEEEDPNTAKQRMAEFDKQRWKYLVFLDEINTVDDKTFNALRRVILEKNFGPSDEDNDESSNTVNSKSKDLKLPEDVILVAAINPEGNHVTDLTDHFRDVVDIIPAHGSWSSTKKFLLSQKFSSYPKEIKQVAMNIIDAFVNKFKSRDGTRKSEQQPFYLNIPEVGELYLAPREYSDLFATLIRESHAAIEEALDSSDVTDSNIRDKVDKAVTDALMVGLRMMFHREEAGHTLSDFKETLSAWVETLPDSIFAGLTSKKVEVLDRLGDVLEKYLRGSTPLTSMPNDNKLVTSNNQISTAEFIDEITEVFTKTIITEEDIKKFMIAPTHSEVSLDGDSIKAGPGKTTLFASFAKALVYTLHIRGFSNDRLSIVGTALNKAMGKIRANFKANGTDITPEVKAGTRAAMSVGMELIRIIKGLP